jgi:hypothetical protein
VQPSVRLDQVAPERIVVLPQRIAAGKGAVGGLFAPTAPALNW